MALQNLVERFHELYVKQGSLPLNLRKDRLMALKKNIQTNEPAISQALKEDYGKCRFEAYASEVGFLFEDLNFTLKHLEKWAKQRRVRSPLTLFPGKSFIHPVPYGTILIIAPWNYPFQLVFSPLIGAIAAGNRVVVKPSELA